MSQASGQLAVDARHHEGPERAGARARTTSCDPAMHHGPPLHFLWWIKAALVFDEGDDLLAELLHTVRIRPVGDSAMAALRSFIASMPEWAAHRRPVRPSTSFRGLVAASAGLQDYRRRMFARYETDLAALLAEQTGSPPGSAEPFVAAVALIGVLRAAFEANDAEGKSRHDGADRCLDLLAGGLDHYAKSSGAG